MEDKVPVKLDLKKQLKHLYLPAAKEVAMVDVPEMKFVAVDGRIEPDATPGTSPGFAEAIGALYGFAYTLKFMSKLRPVHPIDYTVMALEGLWTTPSGGADYAAFQDWSWTLMIMQPDHIGPEMFAEALRELKKKRDKPKRRGVGATRGADGAGTAAGGAPGPQDDSTVLDRVRLESFHEGLCLQMMHIGPYAEEPRTLERMSAFAEARGLRLSRAPPRDLSGRSAHRQARKSQDGAPARGCFGRVKDAPDTSVARRGWYLWALAAPAAVLLVGFLWMALEAVPGSLLAAWDGHVTDALVAARTFGWNRIFWCFSLLGNTLVMVALASSAVILLLAWGARARAVLVAGALLTAFGVSSLTKVLVHRTRPPEAMALIGQPGSFSMPSGHAFLTLVFAGLLVFFAFRVISARRPGDARRWLPLLIVALVTTAAVVLVGLSRVYLGVHWASDVLAGWCLGGAWLALVLGVFLAWEQRSRPLRDKRPWRGMATRLALAVMLAVITGAVVFLAARADPLLASVLP